MNTRRSASEHAAKNILRSSDLMNFGNARFGMRNRAIPEVGFTVRRLVRIANRTSSGRRALGGLGRSSANELAVVHETDYQGACAKHREVDGRALSRQAFAILPKILEVMSCFGASRTSLTGSEKYIPKCRSRYGTAAERCNIGRVSQRALLNGNCSLIEHGQVSEGRFYEVFVESVISMTISTMHLQHYGAPRGWLAVLRECWARRCETKRVLPMQVWA
jgi:hypothetical protein